MNLGYRVPVITISGLHTYPVKSCRGLSHDSALLAREGLEHDREWMFVTRQGRFISQREAPGLARVQVALSRDALRLEVPGHGEVAVPTGRDGPRRTMKLWDSTCAGFDQGDEVTEWISSLLGLEARLVRFDPATPRPSDRKWTGSLEARNRYSDGFPLLAVSRASLDDLNGQLPVPLPMERFRPNLVLDGLPPYGEDVLGEFGGEGLRLKAVKPCARCVITTVDQASGVRAGDEPVATLKRYRWNAELRGATFGQNVVIAEGIGRTLRVGDVLEVFDT
jgi:uncharacterized protein YcbX